MEARCEHGGLLALRAERLKSGEWNKLGAETHFLFSLLPALETLEWDSACLPESNQGAGFNLLKALSQAHGSLEGGN